MRLSAAKKYDRLVFFEHATLSVSPVINALELGRAFAGSTGQIDVIAHSRGGLIVRWWLEAFGSSLQLGGRKPGTRRFRRIAACMEPRLRLPTSSRSAMSLISNIGTFAEMTMKLAGAANPFLWVGGKLVEVIVSVTGALAKTPLVDALVALIPGLAGQSAVNNNHEINRLRLGPVRGRSAVLRRQIELRDRKSGMEVLAKLPEGPNGRSCRRHCFPGSRTIWWWTPYR